MLVTTATLLLSLSASQTSLSLEASVRSDVRGGLSPGVDANGVSPTADLMLAPSLSGSIQQHSNRASIAYTPTLQLRSQWPQVGGVLGQHRGVFEGSLGDVQRLGRLTANARLLAGRVDLGTASRLLGQQAGAGVGGALSVADGTAEVGYDVQPARWLRIGTETTFNVIGVPSASLTARDPVSFDALAWLLLPNLEELTPFLRGEVTAHADFSLSRVLSIGGQLAQEMLSTTSLSGFASTSAQMRGAWQMNRQLRLGGNVGFSGGREQDGTHPQNGRFTLVPTADSELAFEVPISRQLLVIGAAGAGLVPAYDLFLGQLTHRATTRINVAAQWQKLTLSGSASTWSLLPTLTLGAPRVATLVAPDAHVMSGNFQAQVTPTRTIAMGAGLTGFLRAQASAEGYLSLPSAVLPELMAYAYVQASTDTLLF